MIKEPTINPIMVQCCPQMRVTAVDEGIPQKTATVDITVNVLRNAYPPSFEKDTYVVNIDETMSYGSVVLQVTAEDRDADLQPNVSIYPVARPPHYRSNSLLRSIVEIGYQAAAKCDYKLQKRYLKHE